MVHDEAELADMLGSRSTLAFDLDTYRLLLKHLALSGKGEIELIDCPEETLYAYDMLLLL